MPNALTWLFLAALLAATATRLWLASRQIRHVRAHRAAVPPSFVETIPLAAHQKAADYTAAKTRFGIVSTLVDAALILLFTLGGGVQWLSDAWVRWFDVGSLSHGTALLLSLFFIQGAISLPLALYRTFVIESRFGPGSCRAHLDQARAKSVHSEVLRLPGLMFDIDTPEDVAELLADPHQSDAALFLRTVCLSR